MDSVVLQFWQTVQCLSTLSVAHSVAAFRFTAYALSLHVSPNPAGQQLKLKLDFIHLSFLLAAMNSLSVCTFY